MAVLATGQLTLLDHAKRLDPDGRIGKVGELLSITNEILEDAVFMEGNLPTGHQYTVRTGLPSVYWRALNQGIPASKSTTAQVTEACALLEARSHIDVRVAALNGNTAEFRLSEDKPFIESMGQKWAETLFYGNVGADAKSFSGLATRYSSLSAGNAQNIIDCGGTGSDNTSLWLAAWGEDTIFCPFPKGSTAGLQHRDLGEDDVLDADGNTYRALKTLYTMDGGLAVKDWRFAVRGCNIDVSALVAESGAADLIKTMVKMLARLPTRNGVRPAFYMNRTVYEMLRIQALGKSSGVLAVTPALDQFGTSHNMLTFEGVPLRLADTLLSTEARVV